LTSLLTFLLYWLAIVPAGIVRRLLGMRDIDFRWRDGSSTYWRHQNKLPAARRYPSQL